MTEAERAYLWLRACAPLDDRGRVALLRAAHDPAELFAHAERYRELADGKEFGRYGERLEAVNRFLAMLDGKNIFAVTPLSDDYPEALAHAPSPPLALFGKGNRALLRERLFCVVGSRLIPPWAEKLGKQIAEELSARFAIVTGIAEGGDCAAIAGALPGGKLISVLPCWLEDCYPAAHAALKERIAQSGLLLTELLPGEETRKYTFHARNRILAGLCEGVLVLSAREKSGTLITANCALEAGRDVFALPHNAGSAAGEGCNALIKSGAYLVTCAADIFSVYGMQSAARKTLSLTAEEERVMEALEGGDLHAAALAERVGMKIFEAGAVLSSLEMKGLVAKAGANTYTAIARGGTRREEIDNSD